MAPGPKLFGLVRVHCTSTVSGCLDVLMSSLYMEHNCCIIDSFIVTSLQGLPKQALQHTAKGRDILLSPECHVTSCDVPDEIKYQLALAHCVAGQAHTLQGAYPIYLN